MLISHLILGNLRNNIKNSTYLLIGIIMNNAFLFLFLFLKKIVDSSSLKIYMLYERLSIIVDNFTLLTFISGIFLSLFVIVPYVRGRLREYGLLIILGIRRKMLYVVLGLEYLILWGITICIGMLIGLLFVLATYFLLKNNGYPSLGNIWLGALQEAGDKVLFSSLAYVGCALLYLIIRIGNKNLSEFALESSKPEKQKSIRKSMWICICGVGCIVLSFTTRLWPSYIARHTRRETLFLYFCIAGMYMVIASGMSIAMVFIQRKEKRYVKYMLTVRNLSFKLSVFKNTVFAVLLIQFGVLFYVGSEAEILPQEIDYSSRYPHDIIAYMKNGDDDRWEKICRQLGAKAWLLRIPFLDLQDIDGRSLLGISRTQYNRLTSDNVYLNRGQVILSVPKKSEDMDKYTFITVLIDSKGKNYNIKKQKAEILIMGYVDYNLVIFADDEYKELSEKMNMSDVMVIQDVRKDQQHVVWKEVNKFRKANPDSTWFVKREALVLEETVERIHSAVNLLCGIFLVISGVFMLSVKIFGEIPNLQKKYKFYWDIGMTEKRMRTELRKEILLLIWIPAVLAILMAGISETDLAIRFLMKLQKEIGREEYQFLLLMYGNWLCVVAVFILIQIGYGKYILNYISKRVLVINKKEE